MTNDSYADAGLYYLPIERIDEPEFACCKDGRWVLAIDGPGQRMTAHVVVCWDRDTGTWVDHAGAEFKSQDLVAFFPASLQPIGPHVAIECAVTYWRGHEVIGAEGVTAHEMFLDLGEGRTLESTVTVRHPIRRAPHGEAA